MRGKSRSDAGGLPPSQLSSTTSLPPGLATHLKPYAGAIFTPWPLEDAIRTGSLASTALLVERGIDPLGYDPEAAAADAAAAQRQQQQAATEGSAQATADAAAAEAEARERRRRREEEEREREARGREERAAEAARRGSVFGPGSAAASGGAQPAAQKRQFQFMGDIDDDEDE